MEIITLDVIEQKRRIYDNNIQSQGALQRLFNEGTEQYPHSLNKKQY